VTREGGAADGGAAVNKRACRRGTVTKPCHIGSVIDD